MCCFTDEWGLERLHRSKAIATCVPSDHDSCRNTKRSHVSIPELLKIAHIYSSTSPHTFLSGINVSQPSIACNSAAAIRIFTPKAKKYTGTEANQTNYNFVLDTALILNSDFARSRSSRRKIFPAALEMRI